MPGPTRLALQSLAALAVALPPASGLAAPTEDEAQVTEAQPEPEASPTPDAEDGSKEVEESADAEAPEPSAPNEEPEREPEPEPEPERVPEPDAEDASTAPTLGAGFVPEPRPPTDFGPTPLGVPSADASADLELRMARAKGWRNAGIAGLSVGSVLVLSGALMLQSDPSNPELGNSNFADARNRAGYTILAPGLLLVAGGAAMLTVGLMQSKQLRMSAAADRDSASVSLSGRF